MKGRWHMKTITVSGDLVDILREIIDDMAVYKGNVEEPTELLEKSRTEAKLSQAEKEEIEWYFASKAFKKFVDSKEHLIIPEDSLEGKEKKRLKKILGHPIVMDMFYKDFYAYQFVDSLDDIVRRATKIRDTFAKSVVSEKAKGICREVYMCFIHGYHLSSMVLCRALVELLLKERLGVEVGELGKLNNIALERKIYGKETWYQIEQIRKKGNQCLHQLVKGNLPKEYQSLQVLGLTQEVVQTLGVDRDLNP